MRATSANVVAFAAIASHVAPALAAPVQFQSSEQNEARFPPLLKGLGAAALSGVVGGAASSIGTHLVDQLTNRDEEEIEARFPPVLKGLGAAALTSAAGGLAGGLATGVGNKIFNREEEEDIEVLLSPALEAALSSIADDDRLFRRDEDQELEARAVPGIFKAIGTAIATGALGGIATSIAAHLTNKLNNREEEEVIELLFPTPLEGLSSHQAAVIEARRAPNFGLLISNILRQFNKSNNKLLNKVNNVVNKANNMAGNLVNNMLNNREEEMFELLFPTPLEGLSSHEAAVARRAPGPAFRNLGLLFVNGKANNAVNNALDNREEIEVRFPPLLKGLGAAALTGGVGTAFSAGASHLVNKIFDREEAELHIPSEFFNSEDMDTLINALRTSPIPINELD